MPDALDIQSQSLAIETLNVFDCVSRLVYKLLDAMFFFCFVLSDCPRWSSDQRRPMHKKAQAVYNSLERHKSDFRSSDPARHLDLSSRAGMLELQHADLFSE